MSDALRGEVVVITGASTRIGRAAVGSFRDRGARFVLAPCSLAPPAAVVVECGARGAHALAVPTDVSDPAAVDALVAWTVEVHGRIDVWVNAASVFGFGAL